MVREKTMVQESPKRNYGLGSNCGLGRNYGPGRNYGLGRNYLPGRNYGLERNYGPVRKSVIRGETKFWEERLWSREKLWSQEKDPGRNYGLGRMTLVRGERLWSRKKDYGLGRKNNPTTFSSMTVKVTKGRLCAG